MLHIRGHRALVRRAPIAARFAAIVTDLALSWSLFILIVRLTGLSPVPGLEHLMLLAATLALPTWGLVTLRGATAGQWIWRIRLLDASERPVGLLSGSDSSLWSPLHPLRARAFLTAHATSGTWALSTLAALGVIAGSAALTRMTLGHDPLLIHADEWRMPPYAPSEAEISDGSWNIRSFFYVVGAWPARYNGTPVLYAVPYEKGPPQQFLGRFTARWELPEASLTFEGPKTPQQPSASASEGHPLDPALLNLCLQKRSAEPQAGPLECLRIRQSALERHIAQIRASIHPEHWELRWFEIDNEALPGPERARGFYLAGRSQTRAQERYILVTAKGAHQTIILDRNLSPRGEQASKTLEQAIRSLRVSSSLDGPRAWADHELSELKLDHLSSLGDGPEFAAMLSRVQSALISKITVDPYGFDSYFHLGGTSLLLLQRAVRSGNLDWSAVARPNLQAALKFAEDLGVARGATDPRLRQLEDMWSRASKL